MSQALGNFTPTPNEQQPKMSASILDVATTTTKAAAEEPSEREQRIYTLFKELNDEWMFVGDNAKRITKTPKAVNPTAITRFYDLTRQPNISTLKSCSDPAWKALLQAASSLTDHGLDLAEQAILDLKAAKASGFPGVVRMKTRLFAALSGKATLSPSKSLEDCLRNIYDEEDDSTKSPGSPYWFQRPRRLSGRIYDVSQEEQDESFLDLPTPEDPQKVVEAGKVFVPNEDEEWEDLGDDIAVELDGNEVANGVAVETDAIAEDVEELVRCEDGTTTEKVDLQYSTFVGNAHSPAGSPHSTTSNPHTAPKSLPSRNPFKRTSPTQRNQQSSPRETSVTPPSKSTDEMTQGCFFEKGWQSNLPDTVYTTDYQPTSDHQTNPSHLPTFGQPPTPSNPLSQDINKEPLVRTGSYETVKNPTDILTNEDMPSWVGAHLCLRKPTGNERCEKESPEKGNDGLKRVSDGFEVQSVSGSEHFV